MKRIGIIGAGGFVGSRLVEKLLAGGDCEVVPIVRGARSLASLARFPLDWQFADARDGTALASAMTGCDAVVHLVVGNPDIILDAAKALLPAAVQAGVQRIVYLSTASVHGQCPLPGSNEDSPLSDRQAIPYNNAKVRAERILRAAQKQHPIPLTILRPAVVFGPRDRWCVPIVKELLAGTAWLLNDAPRLCNSIHVDNLVHAIRISLEADSAIADDTFLITDDEEVTWDEFYVAIATFLGLPADSVHRIPTPHFPAPGFVDRLNHLRASNAAQAVIAHVPALVKRVGKGAFGGFKESQRPNPWAMPAPSLPNPSREMVELQKCATRLPCEQAKDALGYRPVVGFHEGLASTLDWLGSCGYSSITSQSSNRA